MLGERSLAERSHVPPVTKSEQGLPGRKTLARSASAHDDGAKQERVNARRRQAAKHMARASTAPSMPKAKLAAGSGALQRSGTAAGGFRSRVKRPGKATL